MRKVTTVDRLEAIVRKPPQMILMKVVNALDDGCRGVLAAAPIAGFGFRDAGGLPHTTVVGGLPAFARVDSPTRLSFDFPSDCPGAVNGAGVSMVFLVPGIGEVLRLNGSVAERSDTRVGIHLEEAYVHCAKCTRRSGLWDDVPANPTALNVASLGSRAHATPGPLADPVVGDYLASSPFVLVSSWDASGSSDTSPKGDRPGFARILDNQTLVIPDRKGNRRADTFHNLLTCDQISLAALIPGHDEVLRLSGTAYMTDDPALLSTMAVRDGEKPPDAALVVHVERAEIVANDAVRMSKMWDQSSHVDASSGPDLNRVAAQHIAQSETRGAKALMTRALSRGLAATPATLTQRAMDHAYRKDLEEEGY